LDQAILRFSKPKRNGRLVLTNGCFDLLHPGHIQSLEAARALGDYLIVAINSDSSIKTIKGPTRPILPENERAELLAALEPVDAVVIFPEPDPQKTIAALLPDILVKGGDWGENAIIGRAEVESAGGQVVRLNIVPGYSTTHLIQKIQSLPD
jgi:D-beta-D-heptose 7-phosphate kinase/D-beta-D-heptose 1-phosphate adenosyltransferase